MKLIILVLSAISIVAATSKIEYDDEVMILSNDNFDQVLNDHDHVLVKFYAPWCEHCKALAPKYKDVAKELAKKDSKIKLGKVDVTVEKELGDKYSIQAYPTLKLFRKNGMVLQYSGKSETNDIINWIVKKSGPPAQVLTTIDKAKALIDSNDAVIFGFFKDPESENAKIFTNVAEVLDSHVYAITSDEEIFKTYEAEDGAVILFKKFDEGVKKFEGEFTLENLKNFITIYLLPLVVDFNHETAQRIFSGTIQNHLLVFLSKEAGHYDKYVEVLKKPAQEFRGKVLCVTIDADEADHERILEFFGMKKQDVPVMRLIKLDTVMNKYKPTKPDLVTENIMEFINDFMDGKIKKYYLSQDVPENWSAEPVKVLVGTNFHEIAHDIKKDVLVKVYAPWCGHCQQLAPIWDELGKNHENNENVVIAKMDATVNELEDVNISSYPTIKLYKRDTNEDIEYSGERTLEGLTKFIETGGKYGQAVEETQEEDEDDDIPRKDEL